MRAKRRLPESQPLLTLADIARHFTLPESTARYYCKRFAAFLPIMGEGRRRRYHQEALAVIAAIMKHMQSVRTASQVEERLREEFPQGPVASAPVPVADTPRILEVTPLSEGQREELPLMALRFMEQQTRAMENIAASLQMLSQRHDDLREVTAIAKDALTENDALRRELESVRSLLLSSETMHQEDLEQIRSWVARIARAQSLAQE